MCCGRAASRCSNSGAYHCVLRQSRLSSQPHEAFRPDAMILLLREIPSYMVLVNLE